MTLTHGTLALGTMTLGTLTCGTLTLGTLTLGTLTLGTQTFGTQTHGALQGLRLLHDGSAQMTDDPLLAALCYISPYDTNTGPVS